MHATPIAADGKRLLEAACSWSSTDEKVATVTGPRNDAVVTAAGPGSAAVRCTIGAAVAELPVIVRVVSRIAVSPAQVELRMQDEPAPVALKVDAFDDTGAPVLGRVAFTHCADERVCRGDARGQLWGIAPGSSTAIVEVEGARAEVAVRVVDARTAEGRPQSVRGNPMEEIERAVKKRDAEAAKEAAKAAGR